MESLGHRAYRWEGGLRNKDFSRSGSAHPRDHSVYEGGHSGGAYSSDMVPASSGLNSVFNTPAKRHGSSSSSSAALDIYGANNMTPASPFNLSSLMTRNASVTNTPANLAIMNSSGFFYPATPGAVAVADSVNRLKARPILSDFLSAHAGVIREMHLLAHGKRNADLAPCAALSESVSIPQHAPGGALITDGLTKSDLVSYKALLDFLSHIVGENGDAPVTPGIYSSVCFEAGQAYANVQEDRRRTLSGGAKAYLEAQIWEIWSRAVDAAVYEGELSVLPSSVGTSRQQRLRSFVSYQYRIASIPRDCCKVLCPPLPTAAVATPVVSRYAANELPPHATPLWAFVYHSLRIGDLAGAHSELNRCVSAGYRDGEDATAAALKTLIQLHAKTVNDVDRKNHSEKMTHCKALYEQELAKLDDGTADPYRIVVLNLLGLADKDAVATSPVPGFSLEDFLWANLWFVQVARLVGGGLAAAQQAQNKPNRSTVG